MSNSYIIEPQESGSEKKDDTLIIVVNDDGTISVDQETLQNLIMNQSNANVSVVRLGQTAADQENGDVTLTVDPPTASMSGSTSMNASAGDPDSLVDPFMEMDREQLERLESALQSDEAKQILGENVTAMLDMLSVEEQQSSIRYSIELDHCYTNRLSPNDPKPRDPLPVVHSPNSDDIQFTPSSPLLSPTVSVADTVVSAYNKAKPITKTGKPVGRPRKNPVNALIPTITQKSPSNYIAGSKVGTGVPKNIMGTSQQRINKANPVAIEGEENEYPSESTESSESDPPSDNDSDFGPRGQRRGNVRARGGRKGLTTRGGSTAGTRRRGPNKHLDMEQVRRLNMEMAAAVNAMKSPDKEEKIVVHSGRGRKPFKMFSEKKKDESHTSGISSINLDSCLSDKQLQKKTIINANIINKNHGKSDLAQKQIFDENEDGNTVGKKPVILSKAKIINQAGTKYFATKDGKLMQIPVSSKVLPQTTAVSPMRETISQIALVHQSVPFQNEAKTIPITKTKIADIKKDKRKSDGSMDIIQKSEIDVKNIEMKTPDGSKKHPRKEHRKSPGFVSDGMEPALFSTPDIIRRVSGSTETKMETPTLIPSATTTTLIPAEVKLSDTTMKVDSMSMLTEKSDDPNLTQQITATGLYSDEAQNTLIIPLNEDRQKSNTKIPLVEELQPSLDSDTTPGRIIQPMGLPHVQNDIVSKNRIEGEEHLLATLEMEANKHEEELLAEALLLQEELGVDLADHPVTDSLAVGDSLPTATLINPGIHSEVISKSLESLPIATSSMREVSKKIARDEKEPIQIVRGGRVITLPPIEAPATRSKRLQEKTDTSVKASSPKKRDKFNIQQAIHQQSEQEKLQSQIYEDDDDEEEEEDNSDSEDDPDRLWCICKRPHNNRFMICCDVCEDWFHGKCVHVSKAMGQQMEEKGIEWVCPNCAKKKSEDPKIKSSPQLITGKHRLSDSTLESGVSSKQNLPMQKSVSVSRGKSQVLPTGEQTMQISGTTQCVVCKKSARSSSIYCSDACILAHAQESITKDKPSQVSLQKVKPAQTDVSKSKDTNRVIVFERKTGKVLTGADAPTVANLKTWLKENPTYEVVRSSNLNTIQIGNKTVTAIQTQGIKTVKPVAKLETVSKLVYSKPPGVKQTVLSTKKIINIGGQLQQTVTPIKQAVITANSSKTPVLKQTKIQHLLQPVQKQTSPTPKQATMKKQEAKILTVQPKQQLKITPPKKPETEPIRINIRKTLTELLTTRIRATEDLNLTDEEIGELAFNIELELYKYFKDTGAKYKAKYRSLVFNIKDTKNLTLFRKIADRSLTPDAVVRLSPDEMASQELAEWREKETKHQLEMIKKNELDLMAQAKSIVVKTHKGEQIIENDGGIDHVDPKTPVQDIVTALNSGDNISSTVEDDKEKEDKTFRDELKKLKNNDDKRRKDKDKERDDGRSRDRSKSKQKRDRSKSRHHHSKERDHSKSRERKSSIKRSRREKDRDRERGKDREKKERRDTERTKERDSRQKIKEKYSNERRHRSRSGHRDYKEDKKDEEKRKDEKKDGSPSPVEKPIEDRLWRHIEDEATTNTIDGNDSDVSDREPSSTVNIKTPDINEEHEKEKEPEVDREATKGVMQTVWRGFVNMVDVAKFFITAQEVSGHARDLMDDLPDTVDVVGRISHETVWDYISKMKKTGSKEILIIRLTAANDEEKIPYITLYSYLNSRSRLGVVGNVSKNIKDFYIMPFSNQSKIPPVLLPLTGPGFEEARPHLLLGIIVRNKRKRLSAVPSILAPKLPNKKEDRSYTPPLSGNKEKNTPPSSPSYKAGESEKVVTQMTLESLNKAHIGMSRTTIDSATISKIVPELSSKIDLNSKVPLDDDGDAPYSPGQIDDEMNVRTETAGILSPGKNSNDLQRKMDEINRQIEEQKQQIQNISSSFLAETTSTLPGLGLDPPTVNDNDEAYSPSDSRSFTPPPPNINTFAQPILDKVSDITIPPNLQEILANVKRQENSKVDPYLPAKPSATFLTTVNSSVYQNPEKYSTSVQKSPNSTKASTDTPKESKGTLSSLSDLDLIRKAEEELAARATVPLIPASPVNPPLPQVPIVPAVLTPPKSAVPITDSPPSYQPIKESFKKSFTPEQPKPPGLEDEELPVFPTAVPFIDKDYDSSRNKAPRKSGVVLASKRKNDDIADCSPSKSARIKSRWGQGPSE